MLRPPDRRLGAAHDLRDLFADAGPRGRTPAQGNAAHRADPQSRWLPAPECLLDLDRRKVRKLIAFPLPNDARLAGERRGVAMPQVLRLLAFAIALVLIQPGDGVVAQSIMQIKL